MREPILGAMLWIIGGGVAWLMLIVVTVAFLWAATRQTKHLEEHHEEFVSLCGIRGALVIRSAPNTSRATAASASHDSVLGERSRLVQWTITQPTSETRVSVHVNVLGNRWIDGGMVRLGLIARLS